MTDQNDPTPQERDPTPSGPIVAETDWFLQSLVRYANEWGIEIGITVQVGGMLVSGTLISGVKYFKEFATNFKSGFRSEAELGESFHQLISSFKTVYDVKPEEQETLPLPQYIHLRNARFFIPGQNPLPTKQSVLWRGRVSEVGGFHLGSLSAEG